jgi:hypothetical protein
MKERDKTQGMRETFLKTDAHTNNCPTHLKTYSATDCAVFWFMTLSGCEVAELLKLAENH